MHIYVSMCSFPPSTQRSAAQSFGGERTSELLISHFFSAGTSCSTVVLDFLSWLAVRNFYPPNLLWLLLSNFPLQQNNKAQGVVISVVEDVSVWGSRKSSDVNQPVNV